MGMGKVIAGIAAIACGVLAFKVIRAAIELNDDD